MPLLSSAPRRPRPDERLAKDRTPVDSVKTVKIVKSAKNVKTAVRATSRAGEPDHVISLACVLTPRATAPFLPHAAQLPHGAS